MPASSVPIPYIDATGYHLPAFADILAAHQADYRSLYGQDVVLTSDVQDGEWIAIVAAAFNDTFALGLDVYNSFSPATAQGTGLSSVVKTNGIARQVASYSTVDLTVVGVAGTTLVNAVANDGTYAWALPASVLIPSSGSIVATATCRTIGAITATPGTVTGISTPTRGWQSVTNAAAATPGEPVESDPQLRVRQSQSTMLPSQNVLDGIIGAIDALPGVARIAGYENDTNVVDARGIPGHSISLVVDGGDATAIATIVANKKTGGGTYGTTTVMVTSPQGIPRQIAFFRPSEPEITYAITIHTFTGFTSDDAAAIQQAVSDWTNALGIGVGGPSGPGKIMLTRAFAPALLTGTPSGNRFEIVGIQAARDGGAFGGTDIIIGFNEAPKCQPSDVTITVV